MKKIFMTLLILSFVIVNTHVLAANQNQAQTQNNGTNTNQNREENQERTNNPSAGTMTEQQQREEEQIQLQNTTPGFTSQNQATQQHAMQTQSTVQNMIQLSYRLNNEALGNQIRAMAQNQIKSEDDANQAMEKVQIRNTWLKMIIGANYEQLKIVKQAIEQNQLRIQELQQISNQLTSSEDKNELNNQITILQQQNIALLNQLNNEESGFSLFGWLMRLINNY